MRYRSCDGEHAVVAGDRLPVHHGTHLLEELEASFKGLLFFVLVHAIELLSQFSGLEAEPLGVHFVVRLEGFLETLDAIRMNSAGPQEW